MIHLNLMTEWHKVRENERMMLIKPFKNVSMYICSSVSHKIVKIIGISRHFCKNAMRRIFNSDITIFFIYKKYLVIFNSHLNSFGRV